MRAWGRATEQESIASGIARAAMDSAPRQELLREAVKELSAERLADRIGVWLRTDSRSSVRSGSEVFQGLVWDQENSQTPREWTQLSLEAPLPVEMLLEGKSVEQDLTKAPDRPIIGPLVGLRRVLWTPVDQSDQLAGLILLGLRGRQTRMPQERAESVAAQLALAVRLQKEKRQTQANKADIGLARSVFGALRKGPGIEASLQILADSCTHVSGDGLGAAFAVIGVLPDTAGGQSGATVAVAFNWRSGDADWTRAIESQPLDSLWRRAFVDRRVVDGQPPRAASLEVVAKIFAIPLESDGELLGALVAGFSSHTAPLANLEELEWRAALAAALLREKRYRERELQQKQSLLAFSDSSREPMAVVDQSGSILSISEGARELIEAGLPHAPSNHSSSIVRRPFQELFHAPHRAKVEKWLSIALEGGVSPIGRAEEGLGAELNNGLSVRFRVAASLAGKNLKIALEPATGAEKTALQNRAEAELQSVLAWLEEGVVLFDAQDNIRVMNTRFQQIAGLDPQDAASIKTLEDLIARLEGQAADPRQFAERWRQLARGIEGGIRDELRMMRPAQRTLERAARPVLDSLGRLLGRVEIYRDLCAQRILQTKLLQTEKLAALGQMVSGVAHELSNPLTSILGNAQRMISRDGQSEYSEEARRILQEAERASAILRQLLLNARETLPERRAVSLNQVILRTTDLQRSTLEAEKIHLEMDLDPALPVMQGDAGQLQQVLINLVVNAQQAIEQRGGGGIIRLRTRKTGERRLLLEVEDTGPGIPEAILARIFDPFFTTKPAGVGTGLGLAIVLSVVREHGGQVRAANSRHGGAIFQIELPAVADIPQQRDMVLFEPRRKVPGIAAVGQPAAIAKRVAPASGSVRSFRVLVVEDEPTVARLIGDVLEDEGMHVDVLLDGREALARAASQSYDLVICDMRMPGLDGQQFYKSLASTGNALRNRFLFVTGDIVAVQTRDFLEKNHLPHVAKPFRVEELTEKVHLVLGGPPHEPRGADADAKNAARNG